MQTVRAAVLSGVMTIAGISAGHAETVNFRFSFTNTAEGGGVVRGLILGLRNDTSIAAPSVRVTYNERGFGLGEYVGSGIQGANIFSVRDGELKGVSFFWPGKWNRPPDVVCCSLYLNSFNSDGIFEAALSNRNGGANIADAVDFSVRRIDGPVPVPLPAPVLMLMSALAGLGGIRWGGRGLRSI